VFCFNRPAPQRLQCKLAQPVCRCLQGLTCKPLLLLPIAGHNLLADQGTPRCSGAFPNRLPGDANAHKEIVSASEAG
jgi:hypothetical protein